MPDVDALERAESALQAALLAGDVAALEELLHPEVRYVGPDGATVDREQDLDAHRRGELALTAVDELHRETQLVADVGVTRVRLHLAGAVGGEPVDAELVYTRTWVPAGEAWVVAAAHGSLV